MPHAQFEKKRRGYGGTEEDESREEGVAGEMEEEEGLEREREREGRKDAAATTSNDFPRRRVSFCSTLTHPRSLSGSLSPSAVSVATSLAFLPLLSSAPILLTHPPPPLPSTVLRTWKAS